MSLRNMTEMKMNLETFFNKFPFTEKTQHENIDFRYFQKLIPKIISDKQIRSKTTPNLNIFEGFNLGYNELKHCNVLSWFLDPSANHCQGQLFLEIFLESFGLESIKAYINGGYYNVSTEDNFSEQGRVDITVSNSQFCFIIEAKILAGEQSDQIGRYNDILDKKSQILDIPKSRCKLFFLTREATAPETGKADYCISWKDIAKILISFSERCKNQYVSLTAIQYSNFIKNNI